MSTEEEKSTHTLTYRRGHTDTCTHIHTTRANSLEGIRAGKYRDMRVTQ